jgi:hypothetical protein
MYMYLVLTPGCHSFQLHCSTLASLLIINCKFATFYVQLNTYEQPAQSDKSGLV